MQLLSAVQHVQQVGGVHSQAWSTSGIQLHGQCHTAAPAGCAARQTTHPGISFFGLKRSLSQGDELLWRFIGKDLGEFGNNDDVTFF
jgi:hypothetical protein